MRLMRRVWVFVTSLVVVYGAWAVRGGRAGVAVLGRSARSDLSLAVMQIVGVLWVYGGIREWSEPAADVMLGLTVVGAAEMWSRGRK